LCASYTTSPHVANAQTWRHATDQQDIHDRNRRERGFHSPGRHQWKDSMESASSSRQPTRKIIVETASPSSSTSSTSEKGCSHVGQLLLLPIHCDMQPRQNAWPQFGMYDRLATSTSGVSQSPQWPRPPSPAAAMGRQSAARRRGQYDGLLGDARKRLSPLLQGLARPLKLYRLYYCTS